MRGNPGPGRFIVVEGLDGAGTTTQAHLLGDRLSVLGHVWVTQEPTDRPAGLVIRRILAGDLTTDPRALALLFAADRLDHVFRVGEGIAVRLRRGEHVVCDRYYLSSLGYQTLDASYSWVHRVNSQALRPDLTVFLDVPVGLCLERIGVRQGEHKDLFEREEALERVRESYFAAIRRLTDRELIHIVDGCGPIEEVSARIWCRVQALFDPSLVTAPLAQRRWAQQERAPFLPIFRRLLGEHGDFSVRGMRPIEGGVDVEVNTPGGCEPERVRFVRRGQGHNAALSVDSTRRDLEALARRALEVASQRRAR
jgi:dTMP kinase